MKEENKLIAEFMGFKIQDNPNERFYNQYFTEPNGTWGSRIEIMHFDSSWDWLMPVVEKIESLNFSIEMNKQEEGDYQCLIIKKDILVQTFSNNKIEAVYNAVVNFIKNEKS